MSPEIRVRQAGEAHTPELASLFDAYRRFYGRDSDTEAAERFLRARLAGEESVIFVAEAAGTPVGFTQLYPSFDSVELGRIWILHDLFVLPDARRRGVARKLMAAARRLAESTGACGIGLATAVDNARAQALYDGLGYVRDDRFYHYFLALPTGGKQHS